MHVYLALTLGIGEAKDLQHFPVIIHAIYLVGWFNKLDSFVLILQISFRLVFCTCNYVAILQSTGQHDALEFSLY